MDSHRASVEATNELVGRLLGLARRQFGMEIAWMSSFDSDDVLFEVVDRSDTCGMQIEPGDHGPLSETYCARVLTGELPNLVTDTSSNEITSQLEVTAKLGIGSYVGVPIRDEDDRALGMICCVDSAQADHLGEDAVRLLDLIARLVGEVLAGKSPALLQDRHIRRLISDTVDRRTFNTVFQPVVSLETGRTVGVEALTRFEDSDYTVESWFSAAHSVGLGADLEIAAIERALASLPELDPQLYMTVNASPTALTDPRLAELVRSSVPGRIVLEVTEHDAIDDYAVLVRTLQELRALGVRIAVDDVGAGFSSFSHVLELSPHLLKLDKSITRNIDSNPARRALASATVEVASRLGATVVAEGVETHAELAAVASVGVSSVQGYLLQPPGPLPLREFDLPVPGDLPRSGSGPLTERESEHDADVMTRQFELAMLHSPIGICLVATDGTFRHVNPALAAMLGHSPSELLKLTFQELTHPDDLDLELDYLVQCLEGTRNSYRMDKRYLHADGSVVWADLSVVAVRDRHGTVQFFVSQILDVTERHQREQALVAQARTDALTGLINRGRMEELIDQMVDDDRNFGLLFCDVSGFKAVNDEYGHSAGDEVLRTVGRRIRQVVRESDTPSRWGGDEFVVLLPEADMAVLERTGQRIRETCERHIALSDDLGLDGVHIEIGFAHHRHGDGSSGEDVLHRADLDMYERRARASSGRDGQVR